MLQSRKPNWLREHFYSFNSEGNEVEQQFPKNVCNGKVTVNFVCQVDCSMGCSDNIVKDDFCGVYEDVSERD